MAIISVDTAMLQFPGLVLNALEIGGVCLDDDLEMVDVLDAVKDPDRLYFIDVNSDKCRIHDSQEEDVDPDSTFEEDGESEQEINAGGIRKEENLRDLITRYNTEDAFEESA